MRRAQEVAPQVPRPFAVHLSTFPGAGLRQLQAAVRQRVRGALRYREDPPDRLGAAVTVSSPRPASASRIGGRDTTEREGPSRLRRNPTDLGLLIVHTSDLSTPREATPNPLAGLRGHASPSPVRLDTGSGGVLTTVLSSMSRWLPRELLQCVSEVVPDVCQQLIVLVAFCGAESGRLNLLGYVVCAENRGMCLRCRINCLE